MKKTFAKFTPLILLIVLSGCAASYRPINPTTLNYNSHDMQDGIALSYKYDVLKERGNKKYANKESRKGVRVVAVKLTNNTDTTVVIGKDILFYSAQNQLLPLDPMTIKESIKQIVPGYLPYLIFTLLNVSTSDGYSTHVYPVGLALGPGLTIGNMAVAGSANNSMLKELNEYNILNQDIQKGETVYGIIGIRDLGYSILSAKKIK